jgi:transposase
MTWLSAPMTITSPGLGVVYRLVRLVGFVGRFAWYVSVTPSEGLAMKLHLHANATTTPKTRAYVQTSSASVAALAHELGVSETTIRRWRGRGSTGDRSHARHNHGQSTPPEEEQIITARRRDARLSLDDIVEVIRRCLAPDRSRSAVWRCLKRLGLGGRLPALGVEARPGRFDATAFGYVHTDLKYLGKLKSVPEFAFVAIERTTRFAHIEILPDRSAATVTAAMARFLDAFGHPVHTVLTDRATEGATGSSPVARGAEFTDRFKAGSKAGHAAKPTGRHPFDRLLATRGIRHLTTRPYTPRTNPRHDPRTDGGACLEVERFNRRLSDAMTALPPARDNARHRMDLHRFRSGQVLILGGPLFEDHG